MYPHTPVLNQKKSGRIIKLRKCKMCFICLLTRSFLARSAAASLLEKCLRHFSEQFHVLDFSQAHVFVSCLFEPVLKIPMYNKISLKFLIKVPILTHGKKCTSSLRVFLCTRILLLMPFSFKLLLKKKAPISNIVLIAC